MKNSTNVITIGIFFLTFLIHFLIWKFALNLDEVIIIKFYLFLSIVFMMLITLMSLIHRLVPDLLGVSVIGLILIKFVMMFLIRRKLNFEEIPNHQFHFIIPYFVLITLLTYYAIRLINYDKKQ